MTQKKKIDNQNDINTCTHILVCLTANQWNENTNRNECKGLKNWDNKYNFSKIQVMTILYFCEKCIVHKFDRFRFIK